MPRSRPVVSCRASRVSTKANESSRGPLARPPLLPDGARDQAASESAQQVDAGEALPLAVRGEKLRGLVGLAPPSGHRLAELEQTQVADQPSLVAAKALQRD